MTDEAIMVVTCVRVSDGGLDYERVAYRRDRSVYRIVACPECTQKIYLGSRGSKFLRAYPGKARLLCTHCVKKLTEQATEVVQTNLAQFVDPPEE